MNPGFQLRFAYNPCTHVGDVLKKMKKENPAYRLAVPLDGGSALKKKVNKVSAQKLEKTPALLVSFFYLKPFLKEYHKYHYRDWAMDSGAYSAFNSSIVIDLDEYIETCHNLLKKDSTLVEVYGLDVIGGGDSGITHAHAAKRSLKNTEQMWDAGVPAIPTYHVGDPEKYLLHIAQEYPKIALGGMAGMRGKNRIEWARQCFARVWPKKIHGFAAGDENIVMALPFHSVDSTSWENGPCAFGRWKAFGGNMSVRGSKQDLRAEVEWYLKLEDRARQRWAKEMKLLNKIDEGERESQFDLRLGGGTLCGRNPQRAKKVLHKPNKRRRKSNGKKT